MLHKHLFWIYAPFAELPYVQMNWQIRRVNDRIKQIAISVLFLIEQYQQDGGYGLSLADTNNIL